MQNTPEQFPAGLFPRTDKDPAHVGGYRVVGRLGAGGMGAVYAAVDDAGAPLALKVVHREYAADAEFRARFAREVHLLRRVTGTCVPAFLDADTDGLRPWLGIEYVPGLTLSRQVGQHGPLSGHMLLGLAAGIAEALQVVHAAGIVHRDLKPGNIILAPSGPKVLDFGIARAVEESAITRTGGLFGTPGWLAPEQYQGSQPAPPSDMFAWGGLVAYAATGRRPFGKGTADELALRTLEWEPDLEGVPEDLRSIVAAALSKNPDQRPSAARAMEAVTALWTGAPRVAPEEATRVLPGLLRERWTEAADPETDTTTWASLAPPKRSRRRGPKVLVPAAATLALLLAGSGVVLTWQNSAGGAGPDGETGGNSEGRAGADGGTGLADPERGGANLVSGDPEEDLGIGAVQVLNTSPNTIEIATKQGRGDSGAVTGDWEPRLHIAFDSAERQGDDIVFSGSAEYFRDEGSYTLHTQDFMAMEFEMEQEDEENLYDRDRDNFYRSADSEVLTTLDADQSTDGFTLTIHDVPAVGEEASVDGLRYLRYEPPEELWGYPLEEHERNWYGLCYQEGPEWHDIEPTPGLGLPCG